MLLLLIAAGGGAAYYSWWIPDATPGASYLTATVERGDIEDGITALGNLQPLEYVDVGTQVSGQLRRIHAELGATVQKGDLIAEIDPTLYQARVEADRAQLLNLRAQLMDKESQQVLAQQQAQRQANLARANATSQDALQSAEAQARSAAAQVQAIKAQIQQTESTLKGDEANLGYTKIYAPISGTVVSQSARQGQTLNANQQAPIIVRIADLDTMTVWTQVSEADVAKLRIGMEAYFTTLGAPDRRWYGMLRQILPTPEVLNNVVLYSALFDVPNPTFELLTQMSAQVFFVSASAKDALLVPISALQPTARPAAAGAAPAGNRQPGAGRPDRANAERRSERPAGERGRAQIVRVLKGDGTVEERPVRIGVTNRVNAQVLEGLQQGENVIVGTRQPDRRPSAAPQGPTAPRARLS